MLSDRFGSQLPWGRVLDVVECHAEGEFGAVVINGIGDVPGHTMFQKRLTFERRFDAVRQLLLFEPRGAVVHSANILLPSNRPEAQAGYIILESTEYPAMSGSNTICVATVLLEAGIIPMEEPVTNLVLEAPAGVIPVQCTCRSGKVVAVRFTNQPAFAYYLDTLVDVDGLGPLTVDIAYGGMTYVLVDAADLGLQITPSDARSLCEWGQRIKLAAAEQLPVQHPENHLIAGITQTEFTGPCGARTESWFRATR